MRTKRQRKAVIGAHKYGLTALAVVCRNVQQNALRNRGREASLAVYRVTSNIERQFKEMVKYRIESEVARDRR